MDFTNLINAWNWFQIQNIVVQAGLVVAFLNVVIAGLRAMGCTYLADECLKIEDAIAAMLNTAKLQIVAQFQKPKV